MSKEYLYPLWVRIWHWLNAVLFVILILTGISLHYSASNDLFISFELSIVLHNTAGLILVANYLFFVIFNFITGNYKHYVLRFKGMISKMFTQARYYTSGIFRKEPHPYNPSKEEKFNPLQKVTYIGTMYVMMPILMISGLFLLFPQLAPDEVLGMGGIWPMAILHLVSAFFLSLFMIGHIYLATTGESVTANFKSMFTGWHIHSEHNEINTKIAKQSE
jgi:thiosulfate reductase cytochrome b subunit